MTYSDLTNGGKMERQGLVKTTEHFTSSASWCRVLDAISPLPHLLLLQKGPVMLILDDLSIWHLRHRRTGQWDVNTFKRRMCWPQLHSQKADADLYVAAVSYYYILLRDQARQALLRDDVLNLTCDKEGNEEKYSDDVFIDDVSFLSCTTKCGGICRTALTSVTWLSPVIRCWTVCPSMVVICWMYVPSSWSCTHRCIKYVVIQANVCRRKRQRADCVKLKQCTWSDRVCSWATMMCSCPRACSRSGRIAAWCACRAVSHTHTQIKLEIIIQSFAGFFFPTIAVLLCFPYTAVWPGPPHHCWRWWFAETLPCGSFEWDDPDCADAPCETSGGHFG